MTRLELIKEMDAVSAGRYICNTMDRRDGGYFCSRCPFADICGDHNGVVVWLGEDVPEDVLRTEAEI